MKKFKFFVLTFLAIFLFFSANSHKNNDIDIFISRNEKGIPDCSKAISIKAQELTFIKCSPASSEQLSQIKKNQIKIIDKEFVNYLVLLKESDWIQIKNTQKIKYKEAGCTFNQYIYNIKIISNNKTRHYRIYDMENCSENSLFFIVTKLSNKFREYESKYPD